MAKKDFSARVREAIRERGSSMARLADALGYSRTTFRAWVSSGNYPSEALVRIARELDLGHDLGDLERAYAFTLARGYESQSRADASPIERIDARGEHDALARLGGGDLRIYVSAATPPPELSMDRWPVVARSFAAAIERGAEFAYLFPDDETAEHLARHEGESCSAPTIAPDVWEGWIDALQRNLAVALRTDPRGENPALHRVAAPLVGFCAPGVSYVVERFAESGRFVGTCVVEGPDGSVRQVLSAAARRGLVQRVEGLVHRLGTPHLGELLRAPARNPSAAALETADSEAQGRSVH